PPSSYPPPKSRQTGKENPIEPPPRAADAHRFAEPGTHQSAIRNRQFHVPLHVSCCSAEIPGGAGILVCHGRLSGAIPGPPTSPPTPSASSTTRTSPPPHPRTSSSA